MIKAFLKGMYSGIVKTSVYLSFPASLLIGWIVFDFWKALTITTFGGLIGVILGLAYGKAGK